MFFSEIQKGEKILLVVLYFSIIVHVGWRFQASKGIRREHKSIANVVHIICALYFKSSDRFV